MLPRVLAAGLVLLFVLPMPAVAPGAGHVEAWTDPVDGAQGWLGVPSGEPRALVVFDHGYGHTAAEGSVHLQEAADRGYLAVAMEYSPRFDEIALGAERTDTAALYLADTRGLDEVVLFGVSMGGAVSGLALAEAPQRADGSQLYDLWFAIEPVTMEVETWAEAVAVDNSAHTEMEQENGGTPADAPAAYLERSVALRPLDVAARTRGVVIVQAVNDGLVPYDQGRELSVTLRAVGVPVDFYTALRGDPSELGTTATHALGLPNPLDLAGHGSEVSSTHIVLRTAFARLWDVLAGGPRPGAREFVVDEGLGQVPR